MRLFVYDHCPYCVRVRIPFGMKDIPLELIHLLNDDEAAPIAMIGAKMCPILEKEDGSFMGESLDIVRYLDQLDGKPIFAASSNRDDLAAWIGETGMLFRQLLFPRWVNGPSEEFATESARAYFTRKKEGTIGAFAEAMVNTASYKAELEEALERLAPMIHSPQHVNEVLSYDDIDLFGRLRGITLVKDLRIPQDVRAYIDCFAETSAVPTYDAFAQ